MNPSIQAVKFEHGKQTLFAIAMPLTQLSATGNEGEMQVALTRAWKEGPDGEPIELSEAVFDDFIKNFSTVANGEIPVDYDHRTFHKTHPDSTAAGWITSLFKRMGAAGVELWSRVRWTDAAAAKIRAGEVKLCSPAFKLSATDSQSGTSVGAKLLNVALTNLPFQDGLSPIKLSAIDDAAPADKPVDDKPAVDDKKSTDEPAAVAKLDDVPAVDDNADNTDNVEAAQIATLIDSLCSASGLDRAACVAALVKRADDVGSMLRSDADNAATQMSLVSADAIRLADGNAIKLSILEDEVKALRVELSAAKTGQQAVTEDAATKLLAAIEIEVDAWVDTGFVRDISRDRVIKMMQADAPGTRAWIQEQGQLVPIGVQQAAIVPEDKPAPAADPNAVAKFADLDANHKQMCMGLVRGNGGNWRDADALDAMAPHVAKAQRLTSQRPSN